MVDRWRNTLRARFVPSRSLSLSLAHTHSRTPLTSAVAVVVFALGPFFPVREGRRESVLVCVRPANRENIKILCEKLRLTRGELPGLRLLLGRLSTHLSSLSKRRRG